MDNSLLENQMEIFGGTPLSKWKDVIFNASRSLASNELERLLDELALYEMIFEEKNIEVDFREFLYRAQNDENLKHRFLEKKNNIAIESMSKILSENE